MTQGIRPSQFILAYGPGSILESKNGPVIIPTPDMGIFLETSNLDPSDYKLDNERISKGILKGASVFKLPTNAKLGLKSDEFIYRTKPFPNWKLCLNRNAHPDNSDILYLEDQCPVCRDPSGGRIDTIRFVAVCKNGHLNDINWNYAIHGKNDCTHAMANSINPTLRSPYVFQWHSTGSALKDNDIHCPRCGTKKNFGSIYYHDWHCSGRNPERETVRQQPVLQPDCSEKARIMQRQAANIRIPEIKTLLSIQSIFTKLTNLMQNDKIKTTIKSSKTYLGEIDSPEKFKKVLDAMAQAEVPENSIREFKASSWAEIEHLLKELDKPIPDSYHELIMDEFKELLRASDKGAPPENFTVKSKPIFEVNIHDIKKIETRRKTVFRVTPIQTLQTITVQEGFRRAVSDDDSPDDLSKLVLVDFFDKYGTRWFPGTDFLGEGIFIRLEENDGWVNSPNGKSAVEWQKSLAKSGEYREYLFRDAKKSRDELHPGFVWWHTLSHLLIRAISEEAGYSASSIRERIYFEKNGEKFRGGILLYAAQPGSEGTLGGLVALASIFDGFLSSVLEQAYTCSADPLCGEQSFSHLTVNGSCCYGCLMNSETSCEHRNMWLDRSILVENMP